MVGVGTSNRLGPEILLPSDLSSAIKCSRSTHARCMPNTLVPPLKSYSPTFPHFCLKSSSLHPPRVKHGHPSIFHICQRILSIWLTFKTSSVSLNNQFIFSASPSKPSITSVHLNISLSPQLCPLVPEMHFNQTSAQKSASALVVTFSSVAYISQI